MYDPRCCAISREPPLAMKAAHLISANNGLDGPQMHGVLEWAGMADDPALGKPTVGQLALDVAHCLARQARGVHGRTTPMRRTDKPSAVHGQPRYLVRMILGRLHARAHVMHKAHRSRVRGVKLRVLQVHALCVPLERVSKRPREHPKHADPANQVAMLEQARAVCREVIRMQAASHAAANHGPVHSTRDRVRQQAQLQKAVVQLTKARDKPSRGRIDFARRVRVTAYREVRASALERHSSHTRKRSNVLHGAAHVLTQPSAETVEM
eukprot:7391490-Prymnesium_polylepis.1